MKRTNLFLMAAAAMLAATSCSNEEMVNPPVSGEGNVNFSVTLPGAGFGTRAFADGMSAEYLQIAVYDAETGDLVMTPEEVEFNNALSTRVSLNLANGRSYKIAFFANPQRGTDSGKVYTFSAEEKTISVDYTKMTAYNSTDYDCFYALYETGVVNAPINENVTLNRPVAQINWGTSDLAEGVVVDDNAYGASAANLVTKVTAKAYSSFDLLTGDVSGDAKEVNVTMPYLARPDATEETFPAESNTYKYLSMQYLLVPQANSVVDLTLYAHNDANLTDDTQAMSIVTVTNAPVQANYRTNIYGALLTNPAEFTVTKDNKFEGSANQPIDVKAPIKDDKGIFHVSTPEQLVYLAKNPTEWKGKTIELDNDIDLMGMSWIPIGSNVAEDASTNIMNYFEGTFDGKNHKISNFRCSAKGDYSVAGLFGALRGVVKNLTVENAYITSNHYAAALVAYSHNNNASTYGEGKPYPAEGYAIQNCKVYNSTIITTPNKQSNGSYDNGDKAGALLGYACSKITIKDCDVRNNTIQAYRDLGGVIGYAAATENVPVTIGYVACINNTLIQNYDNAYKDNSAVYEHHGWIYGWKDKVEPTKLEGANEPAVHSNNYFVMNMTPTNSDELYVALRYAGEGSVVSLIETTYERFSDNQPTNALAMKTDGTGVNFTIKGAGVDKSIMKIGAYFFPKSNIKFENFSVELPTKSYNGFGNYLNGTFSNMKFKGCLWSWGTESVVYNNCEFDGSEADVYPIWVKLTADASFNNCKVKSKQGRAFLLCGDEDFNKIPVHNVTINNCVVETEAASKDKAVFEIHTEADAENITGTITLNDITWENDKFPGGLWREINNTGDEPATDYFTIIVNGKTEQISSRK